MGMAHRIILVGNYDAEQVPYEEWKRYFLQYKEEAFKETGYIDPDQWMDSSEKTAVDGLKEGMEGLYRLCLLVRKEEEVVGWHMSRQTDKETVKMVNSAMLPLHRHQGIYTALLPHVLRLLIGKGFQRIDSFHHPTNNAILIPKLKAGFHISGLDVEDSTGMRVRLSYYVNEARRSVLEARVGAIHLNSFSHDL